jgi:hypothetical protein
MGRDRVRTPASSQFKRSHHPEAARRAHKKSPAGTGQGIAFLPFEKANARSHSQGSEKRWAAERRPKSNREVRVYRRDKITAGTLAAAHAFDSGKL